MLQVTEDFFDELLHQIDDKEKAIRDNKNAYMKQQMIKFNDVTRAMKEGLRDIRVAEKTSKN